MKMRASKVVKKHQIICDQADVLPPQQDELLVRTAWAALCGSDVHVVHGDVPIAPRMLKAGTPGHEGIGYVEESPNPAYRKGDVVLTIPGNDARTGTFCDYQTLLSRYTLRIPRQMFHWSSC